MRQGIFSRLFKTALIVFSALILLNANAAQTQSYRGFTCQILWEHVHSGGEVIFEETNKWFYSHCMNAKGADDNEESVEEPNASPLDVTCPHLPPRVAVFGDVAGTQCQMVGEVVIAHTDLIGRGFIDAVDVWSYVNGGLEVCFRNSGWLVFLDATYLQRMPTDLESFTRDGMTCGAIDRIGTVVLLKSPATPAIAAQPVADTLPLFDSTPLSDCHIKLEETLFLRAEPAGEIIGLVWLNSEVPVFEVHGDWYKTEFEGVTGYISRHYRRVLRGGCI